MEIWKTINDFNGLYEVSNFGNVRSLYNRTSKDLILKKLKGNRGYLHVNLYLNKLLFRYTIHRLVALHFIPNPENKPQVNHINGIKTDNRVENLEWSTSSENIKHAFEIGIKKMTKGENCNWSKLTQLQIDEIKKSSLTQKELSIKYSISQAQISRIKNNLRWLNG
jgi:hypothetical protein